MDNLWTDISINAWSIAIMLISITIPIVVCMILLRIIGGSIRKTARVITRKK